MDTGLALQQIEEWAPRCNNAIGPIDGYIKSYRYLVKGSKCLCQTQKEVAIPAIAHMAYGWMPTSLRRHELSDENKQKILNASKVQSCEEATCLVKKFEHKQSPINKSWIGLSKTLHFINPEIFPIWDSNVARCFGLTKNQVNNRERYLTYIGFCHSNLTLPAVEKARKCLSEISEFRVSKVRALEYILFRKGQDLLIRQLLRK